MIREFKKEIQRVLLTIHDKVAFETVPESGFPYLVYDIPSSFFQEGLLNMTLDVDVWDRNSSTVNVDALSTSVINALDRYHYHDTDIDFTVWFTSLLNVGSEDKTLKRMTCTFQVRLRRN